MYVEYNVNVKCMQGTYSLLLANSRELLPRMSLMKHKPSRYSTSHKNSSSNESDDVTSEAPLGILQYTQKPVQCLELYISSIRVRLLHSRHCTRRQFTAKKLFTRWRHHVFRFQFAANEAGVRNSQNLIVGDVTTVTEEKNTLPLKNTSRFHRHQYLDDFTYTSTYACRYSAYKSIMNTFYISIHFYKHNWGFQRRNNITPFWGCPTLNSSFFRQNSYTLKIFLWSKQNWTEYMLDSKSCEI